MIEEGEAHMLDGRTIDYTYDGGWRFKVRFYDGLAAYQFLGEDGASVSNSNEDIPYQSRLIRENLYHVVWHEKDIGDLVSLVIDIENNRVFSAALLAYGDPEAMLHFEGGDINEISNNE